LELSVEENKSKTKGVRLSGDIAQHFYHLVKEQIMVTFSVGRRCHASHCTASVNDISEIR
jgi:hypothetical protein